MKSAIRVICKLFISSALIISNHSQVFSQCNPPMSEMCEYASVLCSLDEMNNYSCNNPSTVPSPCAPLCSQGGIGHNTSWWAFVCRGGDASITLNVGACTSNQGLQYGIWGDCICGEEILCHSNPCIPPNSVSTSFVKLSSCKTYYLWIDGCSGDICDFTINTSGGGAPDLAPIGFINNEPSKIIQPICEGACGIKFFVDPQSSGCIPRYAWTLNGDSIGNSNVIKVDFPHVGNFVICVTEYVGNTLGGSICSQQGPQCATVIVSLESKYGVKRYLCYEKRGYYWYSQKINSSGIYHQTFSGGEDCCISDSIVEFVVSLSLY